jgi:hypothetical protein
MCFESSEQTSTLSSICMMYMTVTMYAIMSAWVAVAYRSCIRLTTESTIMTPSSSRAFILQQVACRSEHSISMSSEPMDNRKLGIILAWKA